MMPSPTISVVLCSYNRCDSLKRTLESLSRLKTDETFSYEIVVVDDGSTDATGNVVETFRETAPCDVKYVRQSGQGIAAARNACVKNARGEWIAFFDDDQDADPRWLIELLRLAREKSSLCVGGARTLLIDEVDPSQLPSIMRAVLGELTHPTAFQCNRRPMLSTGTVMIHRKVFDVTGLFDETLKQGGSDSDLFARIRRAGFEQWFTPDAVCQHVIPAHRMKAKFLLWCSMRNGASFARQDMKDFGRAKATALATARLGRTAGLIVPKAAWLAATGRRHHAIGTLCFAWRDYGYARRVFHELLPHGDGEKRFLERLDYRQERTSMGAQPAQVP